MAYYAALVSLVQLLEDIIHRGRYPNFLVDKQQIASVHEKFSLLQASIEDYCPPKDEEAADCLERRIRDAAYQAQDIIESQISTDLTPPKVLKSTHGVKKVFQCLFSAFQKAKPQQHQPQSCEEYLEKVKEEVDSIVEEVTTIKKTHATEDSLQLNYIRSADTGASEQASSSGNTTVGFEEHLTTIKEQLCGHLSELQVISIIGMGGIGKTTLARNIFDDKLIAYHFDCHVWVIVSQDYHLQNILLRILTSMNINKELSEEGENHVLGERIYKHLKGRRYLIIIDDIWDTKVWDDLKWIFPNDFNRSRIILTTRLSNVAVYPNSFGFLHEMKFLNEDQSWNLFCEKIFCPIELEYIGRLIAKSCRGLPLAIVVVAGILSKVHRTQHDWEKIARNVTSVSSKNGEHFSKILSLSYSHLPHHLKPCFLYMGGFPKDYEFQVSKLIKLWVVEGFLKPIESKSLEEVGEEYLEDLISRNLVLITKKKSNDKLKICSIHDVLRELFMKRVCRKNFLCILDERKYLYPTIMGKVRHLYIHLGRSRFQKTEKCGLHGPNIHSIICFSKYYGKILSFATGAKLLRVLDLPHIFFRSFPDEILELFHLRYLAINADHDMENLPPSISKLQNLQTLIISPVVSSRNVFGIRVYIPLLFHLRHVSFGRLQLSPIPFAKLENLQTLSTVVNVTFSIEVIEMIPNLQKLKVSYIGREYDTWDKWQKLGLSNLISLGQLETLHVWFFRNRPIKDVVSFPDSFAFPQNLKKLTLRSCGLPWKDMRVVASLPNLQVLKLRYDAFMGEEWEPVEGDFLQLKLLEMESLDLKYWRAERNHFPKLQHLKIIDCRILQEIPLEIGEITTLELIEVRYSRLAAESALRIQEEQRDLGNDVQVRVSNIPWFMRKTREEELQREGTSEISKEELKAEEALEREKLEEDDLKN